MNSAASRNPTSGETTMKTSTLTRPGSRSTPKPPLATPAPAKPAISACEELLGSP